MSMTKKDFVALADKLRPVFAFMDKKTGTVHQEMIASALCEFMATQNPNFMRDRWLSYLAGECGPNGGAIKRQGAAR